MQPDLHRSSESVQDSGASTSTSAWSRIVQMPSRPRWLVVASVIIVLVLGATLVVRNQRAQRSSATATQSTRNTQAMFGMAGMSMTDAGSVKLTT